MENKTIFSGVQPSGVVHIGNLIGAIEPFINLQDEYEKTIYCIVDLHAITVKQDPEVLKRNILNLAKLYIALGADPAKSILFVQSSVKEHCELAWIFNTITKMSELERMTQYKDKAIAHKENVNVGLFSYPTLMAADILLYNTDIVPVGEDQTQHVELAHDIAKRFNSWFGDTFKIPGLKLQEHGARIMGLDNPQKKMSKSAESQYNFIAVTDTEDVIIKKVKKAVTDSGTDIMFSDDKPAVSNLLTIYMAMTGKSKEETEANFSGKNYGELKQGLAEAIVAKLKPIQEKMKNIDDNEVIKILKQGAVQAQQIAEKKIKQVRNVVGYGI